MYSNLNFTISYILNTITILHMVTEREHNWFLLLLGIKS